MCVTISDKWPRIYYFLKSQHLRIEAVSSQAVHFSENCDINCINILKSHVNYLKSFSSVCYDQAYICYNFWNSQIFPFHILKTNSFTFPT